MKKTKHQSKKKVDDILRASDLHLHESSETESIDQPEEVEALLEVEEEVVEIITDDTQVLEVFEEVPIEKTTDFPEDNPRDDVENEKVGFWGMFKKSASEEIVEVVREPKQEEKRDTAMSYNTKQSGYNVDAASIVSSTMVVTGDIELETSLVVAGKIVGNVNCKDTFEAKNGGSVQGNLSALSAEFVNGSVKGNITVQERIVVDEASVIEGDITAKDIVISGKVIGEVKASSTVRLTETASIKGDLYSASISIESGAELEGKFVVQSKD